MQRREGEAGGGPRDGRAGRGAERGVGEGARGDGRAVGGVARVEGTVVRQVG